MTQIQPLSRDDFEAELRRLPEAAPLALALSDFDNFKELNDTHGHAVGDNVLRAFERTLAASLPDGAFVGRLGGDEYAVGLPGTGAETALILLEEIRSHFSSRIPVDELEEPVQLSTGIASRPQHARSTEDLMRAAEAALYRAKSEGRDRVAIYVEDRMTLKSSYYAKASLDRLAKLSEASDRTEASLLREALDDLIVKYRAEL